MKSAGDKAVSKPEEAKVADPAKSSTVGVGAKEIVKPVVAATSVVT